MRKTLIYIVVLLAFLMSPLLTNAASVSLKAKEDTSSESNNLVIYQIIYTPSTEEIKSIKLKVETTNDDLEYLLKETKVAVGECKYPDCTLNVETVTAEAVIAELTITNNSNEKKGTTITVKSTPDISTIEDVTKTFTVNEIITTTQKPKSSNSYMTSLKLSVGVLDKLFNKDVYEYTVTDIKDTINSISFTPECDNCTYTVSCPNGGCTVNSKKQVQLETGANLVSINILSEDKTNDKTYNLTIYRGEIEKPSAYLSELSIDEVSLSPKFDVLNNDYTATIDNSNEEDITELTIKAIPEDPKAKVEIKGNKDLKVGENTITITVTSSDSESRQVYTILVTKEESEEKDVEEKPVVTKVVKKKKDNKFLIIGIAVGALIIIILLFLLIFKKKKKKNKNDKNNKNGFIKKKDLEEETIENTRELIESLNTDQLKILESTRRELKNEPKENVDDALDDLMKTKRLELGDLDEYF